MRAVVALLALAVCGIAPATAREFEELSPRNANYLVEVRLDPEEKTLTGRTELHWRNIQDTATDELYFHLYWNAWRNNRSSWMQENLRGGRRRDRARDLEEEHWGWIEVDSVRLLEPATADAPEQLRRRYLATDDSNTEDRTVILVRLPQAVEPGASVRVELTWRAKVPRTIARTGYRGDYFFFAHWFPKLGVYEESGWNCHQFHASTEFYSDYGVYDVHMTVPARFVLGATGREVSQTDNGDGSITHHYLEHDVHGFAWTVSPHYIVRERRFEHADLPPVDMRLLVQPEHLGQVDRHFDAAAAAIEAYGEWYGAYPYRHVTIVDPAYNSGSGGMEYPTLFTTGTRRFNPEGGDSPESVTIHEMGHQFWYGIVGNNEFEHAWLDEGLNTYSTMRTLEQAYPEGRVLVQRYLREFVPLRYPEIEIPRWIGRAERYRANPSGDAPNTPSYLYYPANAGQLSYDKAALWLMTLERHLGWETLRRILSTFFVRYRFRHPTPEDFFALADEVSGQDLSWFFDQVHRDSVVFDYGILSARSVPAEPDGWFEQDGEMTYVGSDDEGDGEEEESEDDSETIYRTEVVVQRLGDGRFPVDVELVFEDGTTARDSWDGRDRWRLFSLESASKLSYAVVDPDRVLMLDVTRSNNSRMLESAHRLPAAKWSSKWMVWMQDLLSNFAFFM